jgi:predicted secreted hydrolase
MKTEGVLHTAEGVFEVEGSSWMDHEFGSTQLQEHQIGWDWFSVRLANNYEMMLGYIRHRDGSTSPYAGGTLVRPDGSSVSLRPEDFQIKAQASWQSPKSGAVYPQRWTIRVPSAELTLHLEPVMAEQELVTESSTRVTYWEGSVRVRGTMQGQETEGIGYVELTGYVRPVTL